MKKIISVALVLSMLLVAIPVASASGTIGTERIYTLEEIAEILDKDVSVLYAHQAARQSAVTTRGPAPALSFCQIVGVASDFGGAEDISINQTSTSLNHGGAWVDVLVLELGYGQANFAEFNGSRMIYADFFPYDMNGDSIVDGYYRLYMYDIPSGFSSGSAYAESTSSNPPIYTYSDTMYIR